MLTAKEVAAKERTRVNVKKETYKAMLEQFCRKIKGAYELGHRRAILTVPPFIVGFPRYDLAQAVVYMCRQLQKLGYIVELVGPLDIRVQWTKQPIEEEVEAPIELPSLVNLQKTAQKLRVIKRG